uniref:Uncharacterized protein n=1 Tax=Anguilla anguilla TaxID=7936 RepID=A0A0E9XJQ0_ANGAN
MCSDTIYQKKKKKSHFIPSFPMTPKANVIIHRSARDLFLFSSQPFPVRNGSVVKSPKMEKSSDSLILTNTLY